MSEMIQIIVERGQDKRIVLSPNEFDDFSFQTGDRLSIEPIEARQRLLSTPDGHIHLLIEEGKAIRVPSQIELFALRGFNNIPAHLVLLTGAGVETLDPIGRAHISLYEKFIGLEAGMVVLEIGSGIGRDALQLIERKPPLGRYIGVDVTRDSVVWCQRNITPLHPNFEFHHFDARHELYNPLGVKRSMDFVLPAEHHSVDRILLGSVFTHLFEDEIVHYMKEIRRVLRPDGLAYATFFLYSPELVETARKNEKAPHFHFNHAFADGCFIGDPHYPSGAVAYTDIAMRRMIGSGGLTLTRPYLSGAWSGYYANPDEGQEVAILTPHR